ncbi:MAG: hypothetical protein KGJ57_09095 [Sphingomonadales bacterium]|nr:hypothetical protein [Sphingomonadales bacterium]MDE2169567.1 hypothetical protein [Sphingomonadales bacterium]
MRRVFALAALLLTAAKPVEHPRTYLLSLTGLPLGEHYPRLKSFEMETYGVDIAAVCRIPEDWSILAGYKYSIAGDINGGAAHGAGWLNRKQLAKEGPLLLVTLHGPVERHGPTFSKSNGLPIATFAGKAEIEPSNENSDDDQIIPLTAANIRLTPARACPPLPASRLR